MIKITKNLISAIMPTYNRADFLINRIPNILQQTYKDFELIIVDDASTDNTEEVVKSFKDKRIKYIKLHENSGYPSIARNIGIANSTGEFITHEDDDVYIVPDKFKMLKKFLDMDYILIYGDRYNKNDKKISLVSIDNWNPLIRPGVDNSQIMYKRICYNWMNLIFCKRACDFELCKQLYNIGKFVHISFVVSTYIWHGKNRSIQETFDKKLCIENYIQYFNNYSFI
jgi:glycosyltransferase involved in cell wall biosynthesis